MNVAFNIFQYFKKPQEDLEVQQAVADGVLGTKASVLAQKELENKAAVLAEQVKGKNEENERRFSEMGIRLDAAMTTAQNHIHSLDVKLDGLSSLVGSMNLNITKLSTILDERLPKK